MIHQYKKFIVVGVFLAISLGIYSGYRSTVFHLISFAPKATATTTAPIILTFNRPLKASAVKGFKLSPYTAGKVTVKDNTLTFIPADSYHIDTEYVVKVTDISSADGSTVSNISKKFKATFKPIGDLTDSERQAAASRTDPVDANPFLSKLPHETIHYKVEFFYNKDVSVGYQLSVSLFAILNNPDDPVKQASYQADLVSYKAEAQTWLKAQGVDTTKIRVSYTPDPDNNISD